MAKTIIYKNISTNTDRSVTKQFTDINEAYVFAHANCAWNEYIVTIL